jgi:hypothetical protein
MNRTSASPFRRPWGLKHKATPPLQKKKKLYKYLSGVILASILLEFHTHTTLKEKPLLSSTYHKLVAMKPHVTNAHDLLSFILVS